MLGEVAAVTLKFFSWLFSARKHERDEMRVSYEGITLVYDRLVKTVNERLEQTDKRLQETDKRLEECHKDHLEHRESTSAMKAHVAELEAKINSMKENRPYWGEGS